MTSLNTHIVGGHAKPRLPATARNFDATDAISHTLSSMVRVGVLSDKVIRRYTKLREHYPYVTRRDRYFLRDCQDIARRYKP